MICTRPDISYVVSITSRYQSNSRLEHWTTVKNVLKYLKGTKNIFLVYGGDLDLRVEARHMLISNLTLIVEVPTPNFCLL